LISFVTIKLDITFSIVYVFMCLFFLCSFIIYFLVATRNGE